MTDFESQDMWGDVEDVEAVETEFDFNPKPGTYEFQLNDIVVKSDFNEDSKMHGQTAFIFKFEVIGAEDGNEDQVGKTFDDFLRKPDKNLQGEKWKTFASVLKRHLLWFGVPEHLINERKFSLYNEEHRDSLIGLFGKGTLTKKGDFLNLTSFAVQEDSEVSAEGLPDSAGGQLGTTQPSW